MVRTVHAGAAWGLSNNRHPWEWAMLRDLDDLRAFVEVVNRGGFTAAAAQLRTTPTVINRRVTRLEAELGTHLVTRSTRGASPTEAGAAFCERATTLLHELEDACLEAGGDGLALGGLLRFTAPTSLELLLVQPVVSHLLRLHPNLRFELVLADQRVDLAAQNVDLAIRGGPLEDSSLVARRLALVPAVMAASPDYLARRGVPASPLDLADHTLLEHAEVGLAQFWRAGDPGAEPLPAPQQRMRINGFESLVDMAVDGVGVCVAPEVQLARCLADGRLQRVLPDALMAEVPLWAVFPVARHPTRRLRLLLDTLAAYAARPFEAWGQPVEGAA